MTFRGNPFGGRDLGSVESVALEGLAGSLTLVRVESKNSIFWGTPFSETIKSSGLSASLVFDDHVKTYEV